MALELKKAQRSQAWAKIGLASPSGGGKTAGALLIAYGLMKEKYPKLSDPELWSKIAIVDTENGSGELYVNATIGGTKIGEYNAITLLAPFEANKYIEAMQLCEDNKIEVCILDSTSHLWMGQGGLLEQQSNAAKRSGNSYTAWRDITPQHNSFVEKMLQSPMHVIATMRSKQEYVQEKDDRSGKTTVRKLGLEPEQRKGMEYEFTLFLDISYDHTAFGSKDRTSIFDGRYFTITPNIGKELMAWLLTSSSAPAQVIAETVHKADPAEILKERKEAVIALCKELGGSKNETLMEIVKRYAPNGNPNSIKQTSELESLYVELQDLQVLQSQLVEA